METGFKKFAAVRFVVGLLIAAVVLALLTLLMNLFERPSGRIAAQKTGEAETTAHQEETHARPATHGEEQTKKTATGHGTTDKTAEQAHDAGHDKPAAKDAHKDASDKKKDEGGHGAAAHGATGVGGGVNGVAFVNACIKPMEHELNDRFWGWRPNDLLRVTDNVNNIQKGVLEVTRRTTVVLTERLSRTGSTAAIDENLERAMNWFLVNSDRYWLPSPESKYKEGIEELIRYREKLIRGEAHFYTRIDNLIPLLTAYEHLLGSCDENLVKTKEDDGSEVSFTKADDYIYYTKGVVSAMMVMLEAIEIEFHDTIQQVQGLEIIHHAITSCHHAAEIDPWIVLESDLSGIFANHRTNMAAPVSHARFYLGLLITALTA